MEWNEERKKQRQAIVKRSTATLCDVYDVRCVRHVCMYCEDTYANMLVFQWNERSESTTMYILFCFICCACTLTRIHTLFCQLVHSNNFNCRNSQTNHMMQISILISYFTSIRIFGLWSTTNQLSALRTNDSRNQIISEYVCSLTFRKIQ